MKFDWHFTGPAGPEMDWSWSRTENWSLQHYVYV